MRRITVDREDDACDRDHGWVWRQWSDEEAVKKKRKRVLEFLAQADVDGHDDDDVDLQDNDDDGSLTRHHRNSREPRPHLSRARYTSLANYHL